MIHEIARIDETRCIGCARCLPACPFDAIVGAHKFMHTVLAAQCTGCGLCVTPCPVDCIVMIPRESMADAPPAPNARENRARVQAHHARRAARAQERAALLNLKKQAAHKPSAN